MDIGSRKWQDFIIESARKMGIDMDRRASAAFSSHAEELIHWNRKINLTAITDPREMAIKHFLDSLAPAAFIPERARMLDIGSGAGFPGIPLKILKPSIEVFLIDGIRKKVSFLKHVLRILDLDRAQALQIRAGSLAQDVQFAHSFDVVISRALTDLKSFVKCATPLLTKQGMIVAMKGQMDPKEFNAVRADFQGGRYALEIENYELPALHIPRSLILFKPLR